MNRKAALQYFIVATLVLIASMSAGKLIHDAIERAKAEVSA